MRFESGGPALVYGAQISPWTWSAPSTDRLAQLVAGAVSQARVHELLAQLESPSVILAWACSGMLGWGCVGDCDGDGGGGSAVHDTTKQTRAYHLKMINDGILMRKVGTGSW